MIVRVGQPNTFRAFFRLQNPGPLINATSVTVAIKNPAGAIIETAAAATNTATGTYEYVWAAPGNLPLGEGYKAIWAFTYASGTSEAEQAFQVVGVGSVAFEEPQRNILVSDSTDIVVKMDLKWLNQIRKVLAFPEVDEILLTPDQVKEYCAMPALTRYFTKFPIRIKQQISVADAGFVNFPDYSADLREVIGVTDLRFVNKDGSSGNADLWAIVRYQQMGGTRGLRGVGGYGTKFDFGGGVAAQIAQKQKYDSFQNLNTYNAEMLWHERKIKYYSEVPSALVIEWALSSLNFDDVRPQRRLQVIQLAQAELLWHLARTTGIIEDSNLDQKVMSGDLRSEAERLHKEVMEDWNEEPDPSMVKT